jgi:hypothetical protein
MGVQSSTMIAPTSATPDDRGLQADQKSGVVACGNGRCGIPMKEFGFSAQIASVSGPWAV